MGYVPVFGTSYYRAIDDRQPCIAPDEEGRSENRDALKTGTYSVIAGCTASWHQGGAWRRRLSSTRLLGSRSPIFRSVRTARAAQRVRQVQSPCRSLHPTVAAEGAAAGDAGTD